MRISDRLCRFIGCILIASFIPLFSLIAQEEEKVEIRSFLEIATEEIPSQTELEIAKTTKPLALEVRTVLQNVSEEIPDKPKPRFVSSKPYSNENLKIQLGYFKEKRNVTKMVNRIKSKHDWPVYVKTENKNDTDYYRVMIVDISSKRSANAILGQLKSEGFKGYIK